MALNGKNDFKVMKINIRALPIIFRKCRPWSLTLSCMIAVMVNSVRGSVLGTAFGSGYCIMNLTNKDLEHILSVIVIDLARKWRPLLMSPPPKF